MSLRVLGRGVFVGLKASVFEGQLLGVEFLLVELGLEVLSVLLQLLNFDLHPVHDHLLVFFYLIQFQSLVAEPVALLFYDV